MTAKDKQLDIIKIYLKPTLKQWGYKTTGQTWWKDKGDFFTLINLQNFSWNNKDDVDFCFNIGVALKARGQINVLLKNPTVHDLTVYLREGFYLPGDRKEYSHRNKIGYHLTDQMNIDRFTAEIKIDFGNYILPYLENLNTVEDCLNCFGAIPFWGDNLRRVIKENN